MTLNVPWSDFAEEVKARIGPSTRIYISHQDGQTVATASEPRLAFILRSVTRQPFATASQELEQSGLVNCHGQWSTLDDPSEAGYSVAAVAYVSNEETPGLWLEAFPHKPDVSEVITRLMDEFHQEGSLKDITFDQFQSMAKPNIIILDHQEINTFLDQYTRESANQMAVPSKSKDENTSGSEGTD